MTDDIDLNRTGPGLRLRGPGLFYPDDLDYQYIAPQHSPVAIRPQEGGPFIFETSAYGEDAPYYLRRTVDGWWLVTPEGGETLRVDLDNMQRRIRAFARRVAVMLLTIAEEEIDE